MDQFLSYSDFWVGEPKEERAHYSRFTGVKRRARSGKRRARRAGLSSESELRFRSGAVGRAKSDYIEREGRYEKDGEELEHKEHGNLPEWAEDDPGKYWEAADEHERANGRLYSEVQFALPKELGEAERRELAGDFTERVCSQERLPYTLAIHRGRGERREPPRAPDVLRAGP